MNKLIIDAAKDKVFFMIIDNDNSYNIVYENSKNNYEKLIMLINEFLMSKNLNFKKISQIYVNRGPGSFAGIRNSLSIVKAINLSNNIDYFLFVQNGSNKDMKLNLINKLRECDAVLGVFDLDPASFNSTQYIDLN